MESRSATAVDGCADRMFVWSSHLVECPGARGGRRLPMDEGGAADTNKQRATVYRLDTRSAGRSAAWLLLLVPVCRGDE